MDRPSSATTTRAWSVRDPSPPERYSGHLAIHLQSALGEAGEDEPRLREEAIRPYPLSDIWSSLGFIEQQLRHASRWEFGSDGWD